MGEHTERSTMAACVASIVGVAAADVPLDGQDLRAWLAERGLGLVPVADPAGFAWPGAWIALRPAAPSGGQRAVVMFGSPSGPIFDPAGTEGEPTAGWLVAPLDIGAWTAPERAVAAPGVVEAVVIGPVAAGPLHAVTQAFALAGRGLEGDRYADAAGTFASGRPGSALTLVDAGVLEELAARRGAPVDHRRNVVVRGGDLGALVGRTFRLGEATCAGRRPCEPCAHLERLNRGGVLRPMVHRGGLRADIVTGGLVRVGDRLDPL